MDFCYNILCFNRKDDRSLYHTAVGFYHLLSIFRYKDTNRFGLNLLFI